MALQAIVSLNAPDTRSDFKRPGCAPESEMNRVIWQSTNRDDSTQFASLLQVRLRRELAPKAYRILTGAEDKSEAHILAKPHDVIRSPGIIE